jgi:hypothetical protein
VDIARLAFWNFSMGGQFERRSEIGIRTDLPAKVQSTKYS